MDGILLVDKPRGWSSFDVIRHLRKITDIKKIGHAGTLDPLATGLLIILFGGACKQANQFLKLNKSYEAEIVLGATSTTDDAEGPIISVESTEPKVIKPTKLQVQKALQSFVGNIEQTPPQHSAIKVGGQRAYKLAREGKLVNVKPRAVTIYDLKVISYKYPKVNIFCTVSSGTYIRSLARELGENLGIGAYLNRLKRTTVGNYSCANCMQVENTDLAAIKKSIIPVQSVIKKLPQGG